MSGRRTHRALVLENLALRHQPYGKKRRERKPLTPEQLVASSERGKVVVADTR
jgi:hypothetical protein